jgi:hypothetical protein
MKKCLGKVIMQVIFAEIYFTKRLEEQGENDKKKEMPPNFVKMNPVLGRRLAVEEDVF